MVDKELIHLEENEVSVKTKCGALKENQE